MNRNIFVCASFAATLLVAGFVLVGCGETEAIPEGMPSVSIPVAAGTLNLPEPREAETPFNLIVISIDTLRADHLGIYGYERETSPAIDAFGQAGVVFDGAHSQSPKTASSHMTLFTGLYPSSHGVKNWTGTADTRLSAAVPTLAQLMQRAGYRTEAYTGGGNVRAELGFEQGFEIYEDVGRLGFSHAIEALDRLASPQEDGTTSPFFLFVHTYKVHDPYLPAPKYRKMFADPEYSGEILDTPEKLGDADNWDERHGLYWNSVDLEDPEDIRHLVNLYDAGIRAADDQFTDLIDAIESLRLHRNTIVILLSDHGEEFMEHEGVLHNTVYQEVLHVPLILRLPEGVNDGLHGTRIEQPVRLIDVMPTLLDLVGIEKPAHMMGISLMPLIEEAYLEPPFVFAEYVEVRMASFAAGDWKLVMGHGGQRREELFDLKNDPDETEDLRGRYPERASYLKSHLIQLWEESRELGAVVGDGAQIELDDEMRKELEALGYLGGDN